MSLFEIPIEKLKGIGPKKGELFRKLKVTSIGELIYFFPRDYSFRGEEVEISRAEGLDKCLIKATVCSPVVTTRITGGRTISRVSVFDQSGSLKLVFFNNRFISGMLSYGEEYYFSGKVERNGGHLQMVSPMFYKTADTRELNPVYHLTAGLSNLTVEKAVKKALEMLPEKINDPIPLEIRERYDLADLGFTIRNIHFPDTQENLSKARNRASFEELLVLMLGLSVIREKKRRETAIVTEKSYLDEYKKLLSFSMTDDQEKACRDCISDMLKNTQPMNRLVQGDVGSGKTAVAAAVAHTAIKNGMQVAFMAPTEILARQHFNTLRKIFENTDISVEILTGAMTVKQKNIVREKIASGEVDIAVGTHALLTDKTVFKNLGLAVTDEQHRFGVSQRAALNSKGNDPHVLVMSATPIPRTLSLIIYGDLDISEIRTMPPGRQKVETLVIDSSKRKRAYGFLKQQIAEGHQCYIVCPFVEDSETENVASVETFAQDLMLGEFSDISVGVLHGKMKAVDKESVMADFVSGKISVLFSTTVIEVGVDVPNANVIMIENGERFGLSQLHQLRGRVGRGNVKSYCIIVSDSSSENAGKRLNTMKTMHDGFGIAEEDLKLRGPGDFFGRRQHGLPEITIAGLKNMDILLQAQECSDFIQKNNLLSEKSYRGLKTQVNRFLKRAEDIDFN